MNWIIRSSRLVLSISFFHLLVRILSAVLAGWSSRSYQSPSRTISHRTPQKRSPFSSYCFDVPLFSSFIQRAVSSSLFFVLKIDLRSLTSPRMLCILNCLYLLLWSLIALLMALLLISLHCCFTLLSMLSIRSMNALISSSSSSFLRPFLALVARFVGCSSCHVLIFSFPSNPPVSHSVASPAAFLPPHCCCVPSASLSSWSAAPPATLLMPCYCCVVTPKAPSSMPASSSFFLPRLQ